MPISIAIVKINSCVEMMREWQICHLGCATKMLPCPPPDSSVWLVWMGWFGGKERRLSGCGCSQVLPQLVQRLPTSTRPLLAKPKPEKTLLLSSCFSDWSRFGEDLSYATMQPLHPFGERQRCPIWSIWTKCCNKSNRMIHISVRNAVLLLYNILPQSVLSLD